MLLIAFLLSIIFKKQEEQIGQSNVICDVILYPKRIKFLLVGGWLLFEKSTVSLCQEMQILLKLFLITISRKPL